MRTSDQIEAVLKTKIIRHVWAKQVSSATRAGRKALGYIIRIGPQQIAHWPIVWDFLSSINAADLVHKWNRRRQTTVNTEDRAFDYCCQTETVKDFGARSPHYWVAVFSHTFVVKAINLKNRVLLKSGDPMS